MQDSKQIDELFRLMDEVCENGDAALPALEQYLQTQTDAPEIDTEASLKKFKADHKEFFVKPHRGRRLCYRVFVVAAAVFAAGTVFALATGHNPFDYAAMWDSETFGFFQSGHDDFETTEDGYTHFPDGTSVNYEHATDTVEYDPNAPLGSDANPLPADPQVPEPGYEDLPDTDLSDTNLEKTESTWNEMHVMEYFDITNADLKTTLEEFGVKQKMAPTKIPSAYSIPEIQITKDYLFDQVTFVGTYTKPTDPNGPIILVLIEVPLNGSGGGIEKDDRPVIQYEKPNATWYIMHNLEQINAVAMIDQYEVLISAPLSVDEVKEMIDSIYE